MGRQSCIMSLSFKGDKREEGDSRRGGHPARSSGKICSLTHLHQNAGVQIFSVAWIDEEGIHLNTLLGLMKLTLLDLQMRKMKTLNSNSSSQGVTTGFAHIQIQVPCPIFCIRTTRLIWPRSGHSWASHASGAVSATASVPLSDEHSAMPP